MKFYLKMNKHAFNNISEFVLELNNLFVENELLSLLHSYFNMSLINCSKGDVVNFNGTEIKINTDSRIRLIKFANYVILFNNDIIKIYNPEGDFIKKIIVILPNKNECIKYIHTDNDKLYITSNLYNLYRILLNGDIKYICNVDIYCTIHNDIIIKNDELIFLLDLSGNILHKFDARIDEFVINNNILYSCKSNFVFCLKNKIELESHIDFMCHYKHRICFIKNEVYMLINDNVDKDDRMDIKIKIYNLYSGKFIKNIMVHVDTMYIMEYYDNLIIWDYNSYSVYRDYIPIYASEESDDFNYVWEKIMF